MIIKRESYCRLWFRCCKTLHAFFNLWNWLKFAVICRFYRKSLEVLFKCLKNSKESTCVGFSCIEDTNSRIESFIHKNKNFYCKTFYGKNIIWNHESANKNPEQFICKFWFWSFFFTFLLKSFHIFLKFGNEVWINERKRLLSCVPKN